ncbi:Cysteine-rich secretory protein family protein [Nannocystis exedens]|uniref:Cysteine-rich secretory protein family protein n=2 Tax=Nannocystis exedens TaxID=54 RepID=A0A1I1WA54_9BACT|nr:Cysteine-rich secretory protein family protein [Nannocystis exedens]SFD92075.1 Cysteine-rich secretory protein family protein [Nannocystis exedens]
MFLGTACSDDGGAGTEQGASAATDPTADPTGDTTDDPTGDTTGGADDPAWMTPYCYTVADKKWLAAWIEREQQVLERINAARAEGADCGSMGSFGPAPALGMDVRLHCAARKHSQDMAERGFFDHVNPDGEEPFDRIEEAGYTGWAAAGENIAAGSDDPGMTVQGWLDSDGHCANLMNPQYTHTGVGFYEGTGNLTYYWTQTFGALLP